MQTSAALSMHDATPIVVEQSDDGIAIVSINRPDRLNALTPELAPTFRSTLDLLDNDPRCRVIILTGVGRAFCAGVDLKAAAARLEGPAPSPLQRMAMQEAFASVVLRMRSVRQPIIAAVNGPAVGIGMAFALTCDLRILGTSAQFLVGAVKLGVTAGELGLSYHLPRIVGISRAAEIMLTGRAVLADEAQHIGLACGVYPDAVLLPEALKLARQLAQNTSYAIEHTKQIMWANLDAPSLDVALKLENHAQIVGGLTNEFREAVVARAHPHATSPDPNG